MEDEVISGHKTLLQKWEIPLEHLDYDFLRTCEDIKKVERILRILKSGEEGFYPDLTKFAENRLTELDPKNKLLRVESQALPKSHLSDDVRRDLEDGIKVFHENVGEKFETPLRRNLPPIRALNKEILKKFEEGKRKEESKVSKGERIKSHEYAKWDKFDADAEELKVDLDHERIVERHKSQKKRENAPVIEEIFEDDFSSMTDKERKVLALRYKDKGNDFFRAKEYEEAIEEYTKSLRLSPMAATYNNRAIAYIKMNEFHKGVKDCDKCLEMEPDNIKAIIRKGQAFQGLDQRRDAYDFYCKALLIDPNNAAALELTSDLRKELPDLPLPNYTRIKIIDEESPVSSKKPEINVTKINKNTENMKKAQEMEEKVSEPISMLKIVKSLIEPKEVVEEKNPKKVEISEIKKIAPKEGILSTYKQKLQEQKKKKEEYKEHFKQIFEGNDDVFLLPHHNRKKQEFIIAESKDQKRK